MSFSLNKSLLISIIVLIGIVSCGSVEVIGEENVSLIRSRRQSTLPALLNDLSIFVGQLLVFVASLLNQLGNALPIILGALGLGGLGLALDIIVQELALVVLDLSGKKRRSVINVTSFPSETNAQAVQTVQNAIAAKTNINNLASTAQNLNQSIQLNSIVSQLTILQQLTKSAHASITDIQTDLNQILTSLNNIINGIVSTLNSILSQVQANTIPILLGLTSPLNYIVGLGSSLIPILEGTGLAPALAVIQNVASGQNATTINLSNLDNAISSVLNTIISFEQSLNTQFLNTALQILTVCAPKKG